ncbi:hypothetical protein IMZ48_48745 [Candidatus Bathyarchaeota archaeon]|nr:hypothetical protein [Candidatus Bathyarchaeota archaeon]
MAFVLGIASTDPNVPGIQALFLSKVPELSDSGASGYVFFSKAFENPDSAGAPMMGGLFGNLTLQDTHDEEAMLALMAPIVEEAAERFPGSNTTLFPVFEKYDSFLEWYEVTFDQSPAGTNRWTGSRLLGEEALAGDVDALAGNLDRLWDKGVDVVVVLIVGGEGVHEAEPRGGGNAVLPAWRWAYAHFSELFSTLLLPVLDRGHEWGLTW